MTDPYLPSSGSDQGFNVGTPDETEMLDRSGIKLIYVITLSLTISIGMF